MAEKLYTRMQSRSQSLIKKYGSAYSWGVGTTLSRDEDGNEVSTPAGVEMSGWAVITGMDSKIWGQEREPDEVQLVFAPLGAGGDQLASFSKDTVINSISGNGGFIVIEERQSKPDGETLVATTLKVRSL